MSARDELFTTQILNDNRAYFFNVKENRAGDIFLQIVESKSRDGVDFERHQIAIFADDLPRFLQGLDKSLSFIDQERINRERAKRAMAGRTAAKLPPASGAKPARAVHANDMDIDVGPAEEKERVASGVKRTGKVVHVISKKSRTAQSPSPNNANQ